MINLSIHDFAFWLCAFFLLGVLLISLLNNFIAVILINAIIFLTLLVFKQYNFLLLILFILVGSGYYEAANYFQEKINLPFDQKQELKGVVVRLEQSAAKQELVLNLEEPYRGKIKINARRYPGFEYGDSVRVIGVIKKPPLISENYYKKEGISGLINFPAIELLEKEQGNFIKASLLDFKEKIVGTFKKFLPQEKAALLAGLTLGAREDFSKELQEKMSLSGTTHLVALSGYNISVISITIASLFGLFLSRSVSFYASVLVIILFVLMTGGEASVVRAAIMGIIAIMAKESERIFSIRNAIIIAAFLMVLANPKVLVFDLGFQLSFFALLGIVYLLPVLEKLFKIKSPGVLKWKENTLTTLSAQLAVIPFLLGAFGKFSVFSLVSNVLIAEAIPITMALGFLMAGLGLISDFLASITALAVNLFLIYELWIIDLFSQFTLPVASESFSFLAAVIYYLLLIGVVYALNWKLK
ncbi:MAG: ComEC/Rec2 family competence protein [Candidatus Harrisonbacteria bacterium]|nr:ComEC/Rec2 family competence protein [Candidatus Harrisonbacteria bacterium]